MNTAVLGAGAWGTALAKLLRESGHDVRLWGHDPAHLAEVRASGRNERYLPGVPLPAGIHCVDTLPEAVRGAGEIVVAVPSRAFREVAGALSEFRGHAISVTKGIEHNTGLTMCGVLRACAPRARIAVLSGPSLALEVARGIPTAIVAASDDPAAARLVQSLFHRPAFRVYTSADPLGVELGGALKNIIAIAAGTCDGLGFGDNAKAALITRALAEMRRLGVACGAQAETFTGLSGLGDLTVTCFSKLSRNRAFGERLGKGDPLFELLAGTRHVVEGHPTARSAWQLAVKHGVTTPILEQVHAMLYEGKDVKAAVRDLTSRDSKAED
ncbi:MAG: NAD(P)-dependent glycerol-3-phosphate dehydrogenase [Verrucomicrobia bacterium]|nr:NAD(P)-dependent glycerol-3-phosphate dehydrogenase [Verrucomicrobiota bacterium]